MNLERIVGSRKDTMTLTMECNRSEKYEKSGSRLQYFVPRHFIEQTSMRKKEVSKKNFVAVSSAFFGLLHASKAKNALPLYKALINKAFDLINYLSAFST